MKAGLTDAGRVFHELTTHGILLKSDPNLPSVTTLVAGEPVKGSWWGHPRSHEIFKVLESLADHPDVMVAKLVSGKDTFVHRRLWHLLIAVGSAAEAWQMDGISATAKTILDMVAACGEIRTDQIPVSENISARSIGEAARELEKRLLVYGYQFHTESGAHAKALETWQHWESRVAFSAERISPDEAKREIEKLVIDLNQRFKGKGKLPWCA